MVMFQRFAFSSGSPKPAEPAEKKDEVKLTAELEDITTAKPDDNPPPATTDVAVPDSLVLPYSPPLASPPPQPSDGNSANPKGIRLGDRRFPFRFSFGERHNKPAHSSDHSHHKKGHAAEASGKRTAKPATSNASKRAKESALIVRALIVGPSVDTSPQVTRAVAAPQLSKVKSQLMQPKPANRLIAELRTLPVSSSTETGSEGGPTGQLHGRGPIHAVCLEYTESEVHNQHFAQLAKKSTATSTTTDENEPATETVGFPSISSASIDSITSMLGNMHIISLIGTPDLGIGQPGDGKGILSGALPTAETVIHGIVQITPQLMALGYTTGMAIFPDHQGIYPPTDRLSVLTYWWGLELALPPPTLKYLSNVHSVSSAIINCLTALSVINNGVREILPFVRYIGQYIDFEFDSIKKQDKGKGVVCAATWIMPAAMVPRPWDFPSPPTKAQVNALAAGGRPQPLPLSSSLPEVIVTPPTATAGEMPA